MIWYQRDYGLLVRINLSDNRSDAPREGNLPLFAEWRNKGKTKRENCVIGETYVGGRRQAGEAFVERGLFGSSGEVQFNGFIYRFFGKSMTMPLFILYLLGNFIQLL